MRRACLILIAALALSMPACYQAMGTQPSYRRPLGPSDFFSDGRASRPPVPGTVARGQLRIDRALYEGRDDKGELVKTFPFEITDRVLKRGQARYNVFCIVCHGATGQGDGRIVKRGFTVPPSYTKDDSRAFALLGKKIKLTEVPVGHIYDVITRGYGAMPDHAEQIPVNDRWAIAAYVRALQQWPELQKKKEGGK
jgi:mono/diheme cytochrome c family protein